MRSLIDELHFEEECRLYHRPQSKQTDIKKWVIPVAETRQKTAEGKPNSENARIMPPWINGCSGLAILFAISAGAPRPLTLERSDRDKGHKDMLPKGINIGKVGRFRAYRKTLGLSIIVFLCQGINGKSVAGWLLNGFI
ncbi:hypothetical protein C8J56DRAFT_894961 [Mycena floridula]|nr:hypothetical protein C8J56DRAFT_894961 [Mycena floridula]